MQFTRSDGRVFEIRFDVDDDGAAAYHDGTKIGHIEVETADYQFSMPPKMHGAFVNDEFQEMGIGTELVKQYYEVYGKIAPGMLNQGRGGVNALTDEGIKLTQRCQKLGYIYPFPEDDQAEAKRNSEEDWGDE